MIHLENGVPAFSENVASRRAEKETFKIQRKPCFDWSQVTAAAVLNPLLHLQLNFNEPL